MACFSWFFELILLIFRYILKRGPSKSILDIVFKVSKPIRIDPIQSLMLRVKSDTSTSRPHDSLLLLYSTSTLLLLYSTLLLRIYSQTNLLSDESNLLRIYSQTNLFSHESNLLRICSQTNLLSDESILLLFGSRSYIGSFSSTAASKLPLIIRAGNSSCPI